VVIVLALLACMPEDDVLAHYDRDGDGFLHPEAEAQGVDGPFDCDDADDAIHPDAAEVCDGIDNNCDSAVDDGEAAPKTFFVDADADGFGTDSTAQGCEIAAGQSTVSGDCDDSSSAVYPNAEELWYDGVDQDCLGGDDYDADADGHRSDEHGGADCDDEDAAVYDGAPEGWYDIGTDNDCDGIVRDEVVVEADDFHRIDGPGDKAGFGDAILVVPPGWFGDESAVVVTAPLFDSYRGTAFAWQLSSLETAASTADADWTWTTATPSELLGLAASWGGAEDDPAFFLSIGGTDEGRGQILGCTGAEIGGAIDTAEFELIGDSPAIYMGSTLLSDVDIDGDGRVDLVTSAVLDGRLAANAGSVGVFLDPAGLTGTVSYADVDALFLVDKPGANLFAVALGDADTDGKDDLGFSMPDPGGALYTSVPTTGTHEILAEATAVIYGGYAPGALIDANGDGVSELLTTGPGVAQLQLPLSGAVYTNDVKAGESLFASSSVTKVQPAPYWDSVRVLASSFPDASDRGRIAVSLHPYGTNVDLDAATYQLVGEAAGDRFGYASALADFDDDGILDLLVGSLRADAGYPDSGAVYLVGAPR
jgi:hypothetical protein